MCTLRLFNRKNRLCFSFLLALRVAGCFLSLLLLLLCGAAAAAVAILLPPFLRASTAHTTLA